MNRLGIPGLYFRARNGGSIRTGRLTAHVTGFTDIDNHGLAGIEQAFDDVLREGPCQIALRSISASRTSFARRSAQAIADFHAIGGAGMVLDIETGETARHGLAARLRPQCSRDDAPDEARFNRNTLGVYEMGSTFKLFNTAMALDSGTIALTDRVRRRATPSASAASPSPTSIRSTAGSRCRRSSSTRPTSARARIAQKAGTALQKRVHGALRHAEAGARSSCPNSACPLSRRLEADQHADHRLWPRHRRDAAAS